MKVPFSLPSLKLTASLHLKIGAIPKGKSSEPTIHFQGQNLLGSGRVTNVSDRIKNGKQEMILSNQTPIFIYSLFWANYSASSEVTPISIAIRNENPLISGKCRLVKYDNLTRLFVVYANAMNPMILPIQSNPHFPRSQSEVLGRLEAK